MKPPASFISWPLLIIIPLVCCICSRNFCSLKYVDKHTRDGMERRQLRRKQHPKDVLLLGVVSQRGDKLMDLTDRPFLLRFHCDVCKVNLYVIKGFFKKMCLEAVKLLFCLKM